MSTEEKEEIIELPLPEAEVEKEQEEEQKTSSLAEMLRPDEDDDETRSMVENVRNFIGGKFLVGAWLRGNVFYLIFLVGLVIIYISARYYCQQEMILSKQLNDTLADRRYKALTVSSEVMESTLRSNVEENLQDSTLKTSLHASYSLNVENTQE